MNIHESTKRWLSDDERDNSSQFPSGFIHHFQELTDSPNRLPLNPKVLAENKHLVDDVYTRNGLSIINFRKSEGRNIEESITAAFGGSSNAWRGEALFRWMDSLTQDPKEREAAVQFVHDSLSWLDDSMSSEVFAARINWGVGKSDDLQEGNDTPGFIQHNAFTPPAAWAVQRSEYDNTLPLLPKVVSQYWKVSLQVLNLDHDTLLKEFPPIDREPEDSGSRRTNLP